MVNPALTEGREAKSRKPSGAEPARLATLATFETTDADGVVLGPEAATRSRGGLTLVRAPRGADAIAPADVERCVAAATVVLCAVRSGEDLGRLAALLAVAEARAGRADGATRIVAEVSTAQGLLDLRSLGGATPRLAGLTWDAEALRADLGAAVVRAADGRLIPPLAQARSLVLIAAAAAGVSAIDTASADDGDDFRQECADALRDGFAAKFATSAEQLRIMRDAAL